MNTAVCVYANHSHDTHQPRWSILSWLQSRNTAQWNIVEWERNIASIQSKYYDLLEPNS